MNGRLKKIILLTLTVVLLIGATVTQRGLNRDRETLGLTRVTPLENAPTGTGVHYGGARGISWVDCQRAVDSRDGNAGGGQVF